MKIEEAAHNFLNCENEEELVAALQKSLSETGFENFAISTYTAQGPNMIGGEVPAGWEEYYLGEEFWKIDPVFESMGINWTPHTWASLVDEETPKEVIDFMNESEDSGLKNGHTVSIRHLGKKMNVAVSSRSELDVGTKDRMLANSFALSSMFAARRTMLARKTTHLKLSPRELETAKWIVAGKTNSQIGELMNISDKTVDENIRRICVKNGLSGRLQISIELILSGLADSA